MENNEKRIEFLKKQSNEIILQINSLRSYCKTYDLINSQEYLDFEDKLNKLSVLDPNQ